MIINDSIKRSVTSLYGWSFIFDSKMEGYAEKGQVFGIDHSKFDDLKDSNGKIFDQGMSYFIYNAFIDFLGIFEVFSQKTTDNRGIQSLKYIGDKIEHSASFSQPPVNLGKNVKAGSYFKNGQIILKFKGISVIKKDICAMIGYDSGESSFKMIMENTPGMEIITSGSSHYFGDIYIDLKTRFVRKASLQEFVISETVIPKPVLKINSVIERFIEIKQTNKKE